MKVGLHIADFTWPEGTPNLAQDLTRVAVAAEDAGFARISVMDHVWQIQHARAAGARDARGLHDARLPGRPDLAGRAAGLGDRRGLPGAGTARQDRHDPRRALRGPGLARYRRRLERAGGAWARAPLPAAERAVRAARGGAADLPADVERRRRPVRRCALPARAHPQLAAVVDPPAPADPDRRKWREEDAAAGRAVRPGVQPLQQSRAGAQARRAARALRRRSAATTTRSRRR